MTPAAKVIETRAALEQMVQWVIPRLKMLDLEGYIASVTKARELARGGLPDAGAFQDAIMGTTADMLELAKAARTFQREVQRLYPDGEERFAAGGMTHRGR